MREADPSDPRNEDVENLDDMVWETKEEDEDYQKVFIGNVPIMLKSSYCQLNILGEKDLYAVGECPCDQVISFKTHALRAVTLSLMAQKKS